MAIEQIKMPQLGESVTEGTISKWLVSVGDKVNKYDPLTEVMTDKVNAEVPSSYTGIIKELIAEEGETLAVGEVICTIEIEGGAFVTPKEVEKTTVASETVVDSEENQGNKARYSPAVLKISQEHGIDLTQVTGTGAGGRITRKDLLKLIDSGNIPTAGTNAETLKDTKTQRVTVQETVQPVSVPKQAATAVDIPVAVGDIEIPVSGIRKAIAANMLRSKHEAPHAWTMIEVDATSLVEYRNSLKEEFKKKKALI